MVSKISDFLSQSGAMQQDLLQELQIDQKELLEQNLSAAALMGATDTLTLSSGAKKQSSNMMSKNFAGGRENDSKYVNANLAGIQAAKQMQIQATNRVAGLLNTLGGIQGPRAYDGVGSKGGIPEATIQLAMKRIQNADSQDASERNLEETKERIEARAAEAMAPKNENGEPIESPPTGEDSGFAEMPEISSATPAAPATDVAEAPSSIGSSPAAIPSEAPQPTPAVAAPQTPSVDMIV